MMLTSPSPSRSILVVDDEKPVLNSVKVCLRQAGLSNVITCDKGREVASIMAGQEIELLLLDLYMPEISGEEILEEACRDFPDVPVIIVTGTLDVDTAVRCMKMGAFDYLTKPVEVGTLLATVNRAIEVRELKQQAAALRQHLLTGSLDYPEAFSDLVTNNRAMLSIFQYIESIAPTSQPVLITGETGVGKELIAQAIARLSNRTGEYVVVNVAGLDDHLFSDSLFGHARGAFTGADRVREGLIKRAAGGNLFLDEIGDLSQPSQVKLLRLLQNNEYLPLGSDETRHSDARIIASTNRDLWTMQRDNSFRKDLNYRLRTHHIHVPPLRERLDDLPLLVDYFLEEAAAALDKAKPTPPKEILNLLGAYSFPGNIRELKAMIFDAVSRHRQKVLSLSTFKEHIAMSQDNDHEPAAAGSDDRIEQVVFPAKLPTIKQATDLLVEEALRRAGGTQSVAARMVGISPAAMSKRLKKAGQ